MTTKFLALRWTSMRERVRNIVIFTPLKGESFQMSAAYRRCSKWTDGEVIKKSFQCMPMSMTPMIGFHNPKFRRTVGQWVSNFPEFDGVNSFIMGYSSGLSRDISVGHRVRLAIRRRCHGNNWSGNDRIKVRKRKPRS